MSIKRLAILGSTGSIGTQALDVVRNFPERFSVVGISGNSNTDLLVQQAVEFEPYYVVAGNPVAYATVRDALSSTSIQVLEGQEGLCQLVADDGVDTVLAALVGFAGVRSVLEALRVGRTLALANKEALVSAGHLVGELLSSGDGRIVPVDSEHSAIFQCMQGETLESVEKLILTASGGAFRDRDLNTFDSITINDALAHPNWNMGDKITIDSATMMNKGLEVIEAHWLFDIPGQQIDVRIHRQSIIHSMVVFADGSTKAQLGVPDMKVPIQYALSYPDRWESTNEQIDWDEITQLDFEPISFEKYPCLSLAYSALDTGGSMPAVLNGANEAAVARFLDGDIQYTQIPLLIEEAMARHTPVGAPSLDDLVTIDEEARAIVMEQKPAGYH